MIYDLEFSPKNGECTTSCVVENNIKFFPKNNILG